MCGIVTCKDQMYCIADGISDHISLTTGVGGSRLSSETGRGRRLRRDPTVPTIPSPANLLGIIAPMHQVTGERHRIFGHRETS